MGRRQARRVRWRGAWRADCTVRFCRRFGRGCCGSLECRGQGGSHRLRTLPSRCDRHWTRGRYATLMRVRREVAAVALLVTGALLLQGFAVARHGLLMGDFRAFFCGAQAAAHGQNPYLSAALAACESVPEPAGLFQTAAGTVVPAPLPPYAYACFWPLVFLPFPLAAVLWFAILLGACAVCARSLVRIASVEYADAWALLAFALVGLSVPLGEIVPLVLAALCLAALAVERGALAVAVAWCALAMIEPHVALPALCALALWRPAARVPVAMCASVLVALSVVLVGPATMLSYITKVLPAHALAELPRNTQFSLAWIAWRLGVEDGLALRLGSLSYVVMLALGIVVAGVLARRWKRPAALVLLPATAVLLGGVFIHIGQMAVALPFVALALHHARRGRWALQLALLLLALPFQYVAQEPWALLLAAPLCGWLIWRFVRADVLLAIRGASALVLLDSALMFALVEWQPVAALQTLSVPPIDPALPQSSWAAMIRAQAVGNGAAWLFKLPTWLALVATLGVVVGERP
ncbi:DUF2029 domain-containing protein [bacterium]|nr:MAG: DUF2029 domain-containing protein [bacterium]